MEKADRPKRAAIVLGIALASCPRVFALDPSHDVTQYAHTAWKVGEGLPIGAIRAIAQMRDGYLWLGTEFGLLRFDGVQAESAGETERVQHLRAARDFGNA